jgi:hypothetical protein
LPGQTAYEDGYSVRHTITLDESFLEACASTVSFTFPSLYIKNGVGRVALSKDRLLSWKSFDLSTAVDG